MNLLRQRKKSEGTGTFFLIQEPWEDNDAKRLIKRLRKYKDDLFTFLDKENVPADNNHAEREIRPVVIIRKNSLCNRSRDAADMQAVMMSIYRRLWRHGARSAHRTLKLRGLAPYRNGTGLEPLNNIANSLRDYIQTGKLPPLPTQATSLG